METTKKTSTTKAALLVLAALSMLLSGLFIATASSSDAQATCPAGFTLSADGANCSQPAANTTLDLGNTCATGFLSPSGTNCWIAATSMADGLGGTSCPTGFSANALGACVASASATATVSADACPAGASGTPGACYNVVDATSTPDTASCDAGELSSLGGVQTCLEGVDNGNAVLQELCSVTLNGDPAPAWVTGSDPATCVSTTLPTAGPSCTVGELNGAEDACEVFGDVTTTTTETCIFDGAPDPTGVALNGDCVLTSAVTPAGDPTIACPAGSTPIVGSLSCLMPVADATPTTTFSCATGELTVTAATPPVATCDSTSGFEADIDGVLWMCAAGTPAVVGSDVLCDLGAATTGVVTGPACLNGGVLSADETSCVVPATVTVAAPVPAFTG